MAQEINLHELDPPGFITMSSPPSRRPGFARSTTQTLRERIRTESSTGQVVVHNVADIPDQCKSKYDDAPEVGIAIKVIAIGGLDLAGHSFSADFNLNVAWKGNKDEVPEIQFYNLLESQQKEKGKVKKGAAGFDWYYRLRCCGVFRQTFMIRDFPFDTQELMVQVRMKKECELVHVPWDLDGKACSCDPRCLMDEFVLVEAKLRSVYLPSLKFGELAGYDPESQVVFTVNRKPFYWIVNYGLLTSILSSMAFLVYALPLNQIHERLSIGFTLNLTVVASYYLMGDKLPSAPYFTLMEVHMIICMALTFVVLLESASPALLGESFVGWFEGYILPILVMLWILYHVKIFRRMQNYQHADDSTDDDVLSF